MSIDQEVGRIASSGDRATHERSQSTLSPPSVSVPCAGQWGVIDDWFLDVVEIIKVTAQMFHYRNRDGSKRERRASLTKLVAFSSNRAAAESAVERLKSARAECRRREAAARRWYAKEVEEIAASTIEARSDETGTGSAREGESVAPAGGDAQ